MRSVVETKRVIPARITHNGGTVGATIEIRKIYGPTVGAAIEYNKDSNLNDVFDVDYSGEDH